MVNSLKSTAQYLATIYPLDFIHSNPENELRKIVRYLLDIDVSSESEIISELKDKGIIVLRGDTYFVKEKEYGKKDFLKLLDDNKIDLGNIFSKLTLNDQKSYLSKLLNIDHKNVEYFYAELAKDIMEVIDTPPCLNAVYEKLELLDEFIYAVPGQAIIIIKAVMNYSNEKLDSIKLAEKLSDTTSYYTYNNIITKCTDLLEKIRYIETKVVLGLLLKLSQYPDNTIQTKAIEGLKRICKYNLFVLEKIEYHPQQLILGEIEQWKNKELISNYQVILEMSGQLLCTSFEGHSMTDYNTFTFHSGPLQITEELKDLRKRTIVLLQKLYDISDSLKNKIEVLRTFKIATQRPLQGSYDDDMVKMILDDTSTVIKFYISILPETENEIIKEIENQSHEFTRRFNITNLPILDKLKNSIKANINYEMYRILVGYNTDFTEDIDFEKAEQIRIDKIQEYISDITEQNFINWQNKILSIIKNSSILGYGEFQYYNRFLNELGKQKPIIADKLLSDNEKELDDFLMSLIAGIWQSESNQLARSHIAKWIDENKHLSICANIFAYVEEIDVDLLGKVLSKAIISSDKVALNNITYSLAQNYPAYKDTNNYFIKAISELSKLKDTSWINNVWFRKESIIESLSQVDLDTIMDNLLLINHIDYNAEQALMPIAKKYPEEIVNFFNKRLSFKASKNIDTQYDAIPFQLSVINEPLRNNADVVIKTLLKWFDIKGDYLYSWEASHLIRAIFPVFDKAIEKHLIELINKGGTEAADIVSSVLRAYQGELFLHNVCKEFIKQFSINEKYENEAFIILSQTGVVSGEYGFVDAYKRKKNEVEDWKKDSDTTIKAFTNKYVAYLDKRIDYEMKRADEDIELRKRRFED